MAVSSDWEDITWRTHLDAYLAMLRQTPLVPADKSSESLLAQALRFVDDKDKRRLPLNDPSRTDSEMAALLLDVSKLRLGGISKDLAGLFKRSLHPRKLDIQKLRLSAKQVYADVLSVSGLIASSDPEPSILLRIEHSAVQILAASLLGYCSEYIQTTEAFHGTREYAALASSISLASVTICKSVWDLLPATRTVGQATVNESQGAKLYTPFVADVVSVMWPLFAVRAARNQEQTMHDWAGQTLYQVGQAARVPKALHLVRPLATYIVEPSSPSSPALTHLS
jgi:hypothetical protein